MYTDKEQMMHVNSALLIGTIASFIAPLHAETYHVYFLGGQSNMDGYGTVAELPEELAEPVAGALIFCGERRSDLKPAKSLGRWVQLTPGFGGGFQTDGVTNLLGQRFGPELTFAKRMRELRPDERIAIIKYAKGGSSLDVRIADWGTWDPHDTRGVGSGLGVNQYDHALATIEQATRHGDIDGDGEPDTLVASGILWMQGETDATNELAAGEYAENLAEMADLLRAALRADDLPFVIGRISDSGVKDGNEKPVSRFGDVVREAQAKVA
ncbi:MAG: sialate O-acetylesterase [Phycisphaerales bacterium]|nr:sialate O-acetylesterase [Phycisphaerales bacterium]